MLTKNFQKLLDTALATSILAADARAARAIASLAADDDLAALIADSRAARDCARDRATDAYDRAHAALADATDALAALVITCTIAQENN